MQLLRIINATFEDETALVDISTKEPKIITKGDCYHDKIYEIIEGFKMCLNHMKIEYTYNTEMVDKQSDWFEKLDFYDATED